MPTNRGLWLGRLTGVVLLALSLGALLYEAHTRRWRSVWVFIGLAALGVFLLVTGGKLEGRRGLLFVAMIASAALAIAAMQAAAGGP